MLFFKSKNKKDDSAKAKGNVEKTSADLREDNAAEQPEVISDTPSLFDVDRLLFKNGYKVYSHDEGRKQLDKCLKNNVKQVF